MAQIPKLMSKTRIMLGYQCHKNMYLAVHQKHLIPPVTPDLQALFDQGNQVTEAARLLFPKGVLVDLPAYDFVGSLQKTRELLKLQTETIFEAAFEYKGCYARADIVRYNAATQRWSVIEVKMSTKLKDEHLDDVGLQVWIMANAGLPIEKISVMYLNNLFKHPDQGSLFTEADVTDQLRDRHKSISPRMTEIFKSLKEDKIPEVDIGPHCFEPRECQFYDRCFEEKKLPKPNVFDLPALANKKWTQQKWLMYQQGLSDLALPIAEASEKYKSLKGDEILNEAQKRAYECLRTGKAWLDAEKIKTEISKWKFPLVFLDFETINPAIPRHKGATPFMQIPFQFSVHILENWDSKPKSIQFLAEDDDLDPREKLLKALLPACAGEGSVVAYFAQFESARLQELADYFPEHTLALQKIRERLVDPLPLLREAVYDPAFGDSFSIKSVGPALLGDRFDYSQLKVGDGAAAQRAYDEMIQPTTSPMRKNELRQALLVYCEQDTLVMVELAHWLKRTTETHG